jgi:hypothetical protein
MRSTLATTTLAAIAAFAVSGCTITMHSSDTPAQTTPQANTTSPTRKAAKPSFRTGSGTRPATRPTTRPTTRPGTSTTSTDLAPRITSPIIFGNGTGGAFTGHAYVIPETTDKMPDFAALTPFATLFTDSFNVPSQRFSGGFPGALVQEDYFALRYEGVITIQKDGVQKFKLTSDDGAILYIDGQQVVNNDGRHTVKTATGEKDLKAGRHQLRLDYFQGPKGPVALVVNMVVDGKDTLLVGTK